MSRRSIAAAAFAAAAAVSSLRAGAQSPVPPPPPVPQPTAPATPAATAEPSMGETPIAAPTFAPTVAPSNAPLSPPSSAPTSSLPGNQASHPIRVDRARVGIVPGTTVVVNVTGGVGPLTARGDGVTVDARYDAVARRAYLTGRAPGTSAVTLSDAAGDSVAIAVLVAPAAGVVPSDASVELGGLVSSQFATARITSAIARAAQLQPGATLAVHGLTLPPNLRAGDSIDVQARVAIDGQNAFVDQTGTTNVHLRVETLAQLDPAFLFYSDDPERLDASADGVLYRNTIDATRTARAYVYHVSDAPDRRVFLALRASGADARVQMLGYAAGPTDAFSYAGHVSTLQYLLERGTQESSIATVTRDAPYLQLLGYRPLHAGELIAAIFDLRLLSGDPVDVEVVSASGDADPIDMLDAPEREGDGHGRRGEFALGDVPPLGLTYAIGGPEPAPFSIGIPTVPNLRTGGRALGGDYGVLRGVALAVSNPTTVPASAYLYETAAGGTVTTTLWFTGDPRPTEIPCVKLPASRYLVREIPLGPGETRSVTGEYMTDGTSSFPLLFGLTATPPSPPPGPYSPDACNPKPVPAPTPQPSATPTGPPATMPSANSTAAATATP